MGILPVASERRRLEGCGCSYGTCEPFRTPTATHDTQAPISQKFTHPASPGRSTRCARPSKRGSPPDRSSSGPDVTMLSHRENLTLAGRANLPQAQGSQQEPEHGQFSKIWPSVGIRARGWAGVSRKLAREPEWRGSNHTRISRDDRRHWVGSLHIAKGKQSVSRIRRGAQQQNPRHQRTSLRPARRGVTAMKISLACPAL